MILDAQTGFSFMRAFGKPDDVVKRARALGLGRLGIADYCSTWGHAPFQKACEEHGVLPVFGVKLPAVRNLSKNPAHDLIGIFAKTQHGLSVLYELVSRAGDEEHMYYRPRITYREVYDHYEHLFGVVYRADLGNVEYAVERGFTVAMSPEDRYLSKIAWDGQLPGVLATSPNMPHPSDHEALDTLRRISSTQRIGEHEMAPAALVKPREMRRAFRMAGYDESRFDEVAAEAEAIMKGMEGVRIPEAENIGAPGTFDLEGECRARIDRVGEWTDEYEARLERELSVIRDKGFESYFWFVADIVQWAKKRMLVGPGRGSAGGCLVSYLLGITNVDPLKHDTLFERFIDPSRDNMPDIDVDFQDSLRDLVFDRLREVYGREHVARLGTVSVFGGKSAINDVCRASGAPWSAANILGELAEGASVPLKALFNVGLTDGGRKVLDDYPAMRNAARIEGNPRHHGVHAAGVCVSALPVTKYGSVTRDGVIAMTLDDAEGIGLLKFDALGLTTLSVIYDACAMAGVDPYALQDLPLDDPKVFEVFQRDLLTGIFQFEGHAVRQLNKACPAERFEDLSALTALARPGPLQGGVAQEYISRRQGAKEWAYEHPEIEPITSYTYGCIVYEEQMMQILKAFGGFDDGEVNKVRKSVKKKDPAVMQSFEEKFVASAAEKLGVEAAQKMWQSICDFGAYAFNKAHSVAYSMVSYQCAWLKAYYPTELAVGLLRHCSDDERAKVILRDVTAAGVDFVPFDLHKSEVHWTVKDGVLYGGMVGVRGVGYKTAEALISLRESDPEGFEANLKPGQKSKLLADRNTPWHDIDEIGKRFGHIIDNPDANNVRGPVYRIADVPHVKGSYVALAKIKKLMPKDQNDPDRMAKRGGREVSGPTKFLNVILEDDGIEMGCTINRFKFEDMGSPLLEADATGEFVLLRGDILGSDGPKWLMVDKLKRLGR